MPAAQEGIADEYDIDGCTASDVKCTSRHNLEGGGGKSTFLIRVHRGRNATQYRRRRNRGAVFNGRWCEKFTRQQLDRPGWLLVVRAANVVIFFLGGGVDVLKTRNTQERSVCSVLQFTQNVPRPSLTCKVHCGRVRSLPGSFPSVGE